MLGLHTTTVSGASALMIEYIRVQTSLKAVGWRPYTIQLPVNCTSTGRSARSLPAERVQRTSGAHRRKTVRPSPWIVLICTARERMSASVTAARP